VKAPLPVAAHGSPFGPRLHGLALYLKTFQAISFARLEGVLSDLFGVKISQGALNNMLKRSHASFTIKQLSSRTCAVLTWWPVMKPASALRASTAIIGYKHPKGGSILNAKPGSVLNAH
ncbi:MAG: transposase, partial [Planctomycetaceae bacterium]|nr:transposase [Planctomycetaceae bacterium]